MSADVPGSPSRDDAELSSPQARLRRLRERVDRYLVRTTTAALADALRASREPISRGPYGTYVGAERVLVTTTWGGKMLVPGTDLSLTPELVAQGVYDVPFTAFVQRHIKPGDVVFDVGASLWVFTLLLAYQVWEFGRVVSYEASPGNVELLRDNVAMNYLHDRVEIVPKAAAASTEKLPFLAPRRFVANGSLQAPEHLLASDDRIDTIDRIEVEAEPLDVHLGRFDRIDLIKIDVDGGEEQVFAGMEGLLESGVVRRVGFELARLHLADD